MKKMLNIYIDSIIGSLVPELSNHYHNMFKYHRRMDGSIREGSVLFVGDSLTQSLNVASVCKDAINYGIGSDTTFGVIKRIGHYKSINNCRAVVLTIGVNDIPRRDNDKIVKNYRHIISMIPKESAVIINSILPVDERVKRWRLNNNRVDTLNEKLEMISMENDNCFFLKVNAMMKDSSGNLSDDFHIGDGLHLNSLGYSKWTSVLNDFINNYVEASPVSTAQGVSS